MFPSRDHVSEPRSCFRAATTFPSRDQRERSIHFFTTIPAPNYSAAASTSSGAGLPRFAYRIFPDFPIR